MQRVVAPELLDSDQCSPQEVEKSLRDLSRINRWFGGVTTTRKMIERVADATGEKHLSLLEVAAGHGEVPKLAAQQLARRGITLDVTLLDLKHSHLTSGNRSVVADALSLPFPDKSFDMVSCTLFAHHLEPPQLTQFVTEAARVSRRAVLINDLVRHPLHLALVYPGGLLMRSRVAWLDGLTSVRRAYTTEEMRGIVGSAFRENTKARIEIARHYLFRMSVIVWIDPEISARPALP